MKKETALEQFFSQLEQMQYFIGNDILRKYKELLEVEREQIQSAYNQGEFDCGCNGTASEYFDKTYNV